MISFNQVVLVGNVGRDPEQRATPEGTPVTSFPLAVDSYAGKDESGKTKESVMWVNIVAWRTLAESVAKIVKKGRLVLVSGKLSVRKYTGKNNAEKTAVEVIASAVQLLDTKAKQGEKPAPEAA